MRLAAIMLAIAAASVVVTLIINAFTARRAKIIKYIVSLIPFFYGAYNLFIVYMDTGMEGFRDLAGMLLALMAFVSFISMLLCSIILDLLSRRRRWLFKR